jgi:hypothetical protein
MGPESGPSIKEPETKVKSFGEIDFISATRLSLRVSDCWRRNYQAKGGCYGLYMKYAQKVHILTTWSPVGGPNH